MSDYKSILGAVGRTCALGVSMLVVATNVMANDSDRITLLEREVQELKLRLMKIEAPQEGTSNRPAPAVSKDGWKLLANWRSVRKGLTADEVRSVLGEPETVRASGPFTVWNYANRGRIEFYQEKVDGWSEPR